MLNTQHQAEDKLIILYVLNKIKTAALVTTLKQTLQLPSLLPFSNASMVTLVPL